MDWTNGHVCQKGRICPGICQIMDQQMKILFICIILHIFFAINKKRPYVPSNIKARELKKETFFVRIRTQSAAVASRRATNSATPLPI